MSLYSVSIITLTYNNWSLLEPAIKSVFNQRISNALSVEYLIVDDGTVGFDLGYVRALVDKYGSSSDISVKIIVNPVNVGTVKSFNSAISSSSGDIIIPLSADDKFSAPNIVDIILSEFESSGAKVITAKRNMIMTGSGETVVFPDLKLNQLFKFCRRRELLSYISVHGNIISGASTYYHKDVFDDFGKFDENFKLLEDYPYYFHIISRGCYIHFIDVSTIDYCCDGVSSGGSYLFRVDISNLFSDISKSKTLSWLEKNIVFYRRVFPTKSKSKFLAFFMLNFCRCLIVSDRVFLRLFNRSWIYLVSRLS